MFIVSAQSNISHNISTSAKSEFMITPTHFLLVPYSGFVEHSRTLPTNAQFTSPNKKKIKLLVSGHFISYSQETTPLMNCQEGITN